MNIDASPENVIIQRRSGARIFSFASVLLQIVMTLVLHWTASVVLAQTPVNAAGTSISEERLKAASLSKFPNYIEWPAASFAAPESPFVFGVVAADDIADALALLTSGRMINNRPIIIKKLRADAAVTGVHVLFVGKAELAKQPQFLKPLQNHPVLIVTETEGALTQGSMINFRLVEERVRFDIAIDTVEKAGLTLNSRILSVALHVIKEALP